MDLYGNHTSSCPQTSIQLSGMEIECTFSPLLSKTSRVSCSALSSIDNKIYCISQAKRFACRLNLCTTYKLCVDEGHVNDPNRARFHLPRVKVFDFAGHRTIYLIPSILVDAPIHYTGIYGKKLGFSAGFIDISSLFSRQD